MKSTRLFQFMLNLNTPFLWFLISLNFFTGSDLFEGMLSSCSIYTNNALSFHRDGDQLNFFRVYDRGDGTLTPLSETLRYNFNFIDLWVFFTFIPLAPVLIVFLPVSLGNVFKIFLRIFCFGT